MENKKDRKEEKNKAPYVIEMLHITKDFPGIRANDDITLRLRKGEIHALLGENGAGKSTLMSILFGLNKPDKGQIRKDGKPIILHDPNEATKLGIGMVHQHFKLVECFTVLENIILGAETVKYGILRKQEARKKVNALCEEYGLFVDLDAKIEDCTVGMQQRTEILKMLYRDNEILIFDEPTAVLTPHEIDELMAIMKRLSGEGKTILFITHKLNEIMTVADRCTVLRKGQFVTTVEIGDTTKEALATYMVGREVHFSTEKLAAKPKDEVLRVEHLYVNGRSNKKYAVRDVSFSVRAGEIVCIAGIDGNGQDELVYGLTGLLPPASRMHYGKYPKKESRGKIFLREKDVTRASVRQKNRLGLSYIPADRHKHGLVLDYTVEQNMVLRRYFELPFSRLGFFNFAATKEYAKRLSEAYDVRSGQGEKTIIRQLSGGNQQKCIVARELDKPHSLLVAVQPTRGMDVGAIEAIHRQIVKKRDEGVGVLLVSLEMDEIMNLADRILVIFEGELVGELDPKQTTVQELGLYMAGAKRS